MTEFRMKRNCFLKYSSNNRSYNFCSLQSRKNIYCETLGLMLLIFDKTLLARYLFNYFLNKRDSFDMFMTMF